MKLLLLTLLLSSCYAGEYSTLAKRDVCECVVKEIARGNSITVYTSDMRKWDELEAYYSQHYDYVYIHLYEKRIFEKH